MLPMCGLEVSLLAGLPVDLQVADKVEAFQHGLVLRGAARKKLPELACAQEWDDHIPTGRSNETPDHASAAYG